MFSLNRYRDVLGLIKRRCGSSIAWWRSYQELIAGGHFTWLHACLLPACSHIQCEIPQSHNVVAREDFHLLFLSKTTTTKTEFTSYNAGLLLMFVHQLEHQNGEHHHCRIAFAVRCSLVRHQWPLYLVHIWRGQWITQILIFSETTSELINLFCDLVYPLYYMLLSIWMYSFLSNFSDFHFSAISAILCSRSRI